MPFILSCGDKTFSLSKPVVIGRPDFSDNSLLSRAHFSAHEIDGEIFVKDLGSANGTFLRGKKLKPKEDVEIKAGDTLMAGELEFTLEELATVAQIPRKAIAAGLFLIFMLSHLVNSDIAFGRAIGWQGIVFFLATAAIPVGVSLALADWLIEWSGQTDYWTPLRYGTAVLISTVMLNFSLVSVLDSQTSLGESLSTNKIKFHCLAHFNGKECVHQIQTCPLCSRGLASVERKKITTNLNQAFPKPASLPPPEPHK